MSRLVRIVRRYRINRKTDKHVYVSWEEKFVSEPVSAYHWTRWSSGWKKRSTKMTLARLKIYNRNPPK